MENKKLETLKEIIKKFDTGYYKKEIEKLQKQISNIKLGRPKNEGVYDNVVSEIVPVGQIKKRVAILEKRMQDMKKTEESISLNLCKLRSLIDELERKAEEDFLLDSLDTMIRRSSECKELENYEKNKSKYFKLYRKSSRPIWISQKKISKQAYKIIKKNISKKVYNVTKNKYHMLHSNDDFYETMKYSFEENKKNINDEFDMMRSINSDFEEKYDTDIDDRHYVIDSIHGILPISPKLSRLGVDIKKIKEADKGIRGEIKIDALTSYGRDAYAILRKLKRAEQLNIKMKVIIEIKEKCNKIIEISRENRYIERVLDAFSETTVTKSELYKGLQEIVYNQENNLKNLVDEVEKMYDKNELETKIELAGKLQELYMQAEGLKMRIEKSDVYEANLLEEEYRKIKYEIFIILKDNPDLNKLEYNDIYEIINREIEQYGKRKANPIKPLIEKDDEEVLVSSEIQTQMPSKPSFDHVEVKDVISSESANLEPSYIESLEPKNEEKTDMKKFNLSYNMQTLRTVYYQKYMKEKVLNSDLSKLSFSSYLESVNPQLTELITKEKEREKLARTIYKDYLKYYGSVKNKAFAMSFYEFAQNNYGISNIDVPVEYDEEYKGIRK